MKRIFPILTAAVMAVCTLSVLPQIVASAITNDEILEQQLTMPVISIDTLGNSVNPRNPTPMRKSPSGTRTEP